MEVIETETMLDGNDAGLGPGTTIVVPDDPRMFSLGSSIANEQCMNAGCVIVEKNDLFRTLHDLTAKGIDAVGLTWSADLEEKKLRGGWDGISILGKLDHYDGSSLFGTPALCVLSKKGSTWKDIPDKPRITIDRRYPNIGRSYVSDMRKGAMVQLSPPNACPGCGISEDSDLIIAMIDGEDIIERGLYPLDILLRNDPILIRADPEGDAPSEIDQ